MTDAIAKVTTDTRTVRHVTIDAGRSFEEFRADYEAAVPHFDRLEAIGVVLSGAGWEAIKGLSAATATHGFVNFFTFDPTPVMKLNGNMGRGVTYLAGNIVEAEKGFRIDPSCFLYLPLRLVISEAADGNALLGFDQPRDLLAGLSTSGLDGVGDSFANAFARLLEYLQLPVPEGLAH
jgi:uncharacterized protein (DUF302 family)